jgi:hypothetical protein
LPSTPPDAASYTVTYSGLSSLGPKVEVTIHPKTMQPTASNANLTLLCARTEERPRMGRSHRGNEVSEMGERGDAGEWSL